MKNEYSTSDLPLAAVIALTEKIVRVDASNPHRVAFIFENTDKVQRLVMDYSAAKLSVEPRGYYQSIKNLKSILYEKK